MAHLRVHVHEMDCADEAALVRRVLAPNGAIRSIEFDLIHGFVDITYDERSTSEAALVNAVRDTGLGAHAVHGEDGHRAVAHEHAADAYRPHASTIATAISAALFLTGWVIEGVRAERWLDVFVDAGHRGHDRRAVVAYGLSAAAGLWPLWPRATAAIRHLRLDMHALVCLTVLGAAASGQWAEGAAVACLFGLAHRMEAWSIERARREIAALVGRGPSLVAEGPQQSAQLAPVTSAVERWSGSGGETERWIERFAAVYTPAVVAAAVVVAIIPPLVDGVWSTWFYRALVFLVLACPCALVISTPVTMIAALSAAAQHGVLVRGGAVLERAARAATPSRQGLSEVGVVVVGAQAIAEIESADVVLTKSDDQAVAQLVGHARRAMHVLRQNVAIALLTKLAFLAAAVVGFAPLWLAVLADTGATLIVTLNGLRLLGAGPDTPR
jgi:cation transport ATPase